MTSVQISSKNVLSPGFPVESSTLKNGCVCVWLLNVDGRIWIRIGGKGVGEEGGGREHERLRQEKEARGGWANVVLMFRV